MAFKDKTTVHLSSAQRKALRQIIRTGTHPAALLRRAHILLKADADGPGAWSDERIAEALDTTRITVRRVRQHSSPRDWTPRFIASDRRAANTASSMASRKPSSSPSPVHPLPRADRVGR